MRIHRPDRDHLRREVRLSGFTLSELLAVVVILGLIAAAALVSVRLPVASARREMGRERLQTIDQQLRTRTSRTGRAAILSIDLDTGAVTRRHAGDESERGVSLASAPLDCVLVSNRRVEYGNVDITYAPDGTSPTYAVQFRGSPDDAWLLVCGGTGQWQEIGDDRKLEAIFELLATRIDAD